VASATTSAALQDGGSEHDRGKDRGRDLLIVEEDEDQLYREGEMVRLEPQDGEHEDIIVPAREVRLQDESRT
jgi:hypothetical protein